LTPASDGQREPIRFAWFWVGVLVLVAAGAPWYLRRGSFGPVVLGLPYWVWKSVALSIAFCVYVRWACLRLWSLVEDDEERARAERAGRLAG